MKKILICSMTVLALTACKKETLDHKLTAHFNCEKIADGTSGDILYKCPVSDHWTKIQEAEPKAMFLSPFDLTTIDTENFVYVNVIPAGIIESKCCPEGTSQMRTMIKNPVFDGQKYYAVLDCE